MKPALPRQRQHGVALMAMLAVLILGATWWTVTALSNTVNRTAEQRAQNAQVLQQAKTALMGWVAHQAAMAGENNPGRLPCPEPAANIGTANQGLAANTCALPTVGRLPWRTLGLDQLRDAAGEPLWYVVSSGWALDGVVANTVINSNSVGALTLDATGDVVALMIAPGAPLTVVDPACTPRNQVRAAPGNVLDYLECANVDAAPNVFASNGPTGSFNDQVLAIAAAELLPIIESAVASRFAREFGPSMRYCDGVWTPCTGAGAAVYYPFAANFLDPGTNTFPSNFQGVVDRLGGLPPLSFSGTGGCLANTPFAPFCAPPPACAAGNRCAPNLITYGNTPTFTRTAAGSGDVQIQGSNCNVAAGPPSTLNCTLNIRYFPTTVQANRWIEFDMVVTSANVGMALRQINTAVQITGVQTAGAGTINAPFGYTVNQARMNADGSARVTIATRVAGAGGLGISDLLCGLGGLLGFLFNCDQQTISLPFMWLDQPLLYANTPGTDWFYRNGWDLLMYYAVSAGNAPSGNGTCTSAPPNPQTCLTVTGLNPNNTQRAIAIIPGRPLTVPPQPTQPRPPALLTDWLEGVNANASPNANFGRYQQNLVFNRSFNDRLVAIESNP